nr:histidine kinase [Conexibacter arvalis]
MVVRVGLDLAGVLSNRSDDQWLRELGIFAPAAAGGLLLRDRAEALQRARRRAAAAGDDDAVDLALVAERTRIARELHAVVRGCVRAVLDEVAAARSTLAARTGVSRAALRRARDASQQAMGEMRRMLLLLRSEAGDGAAPAAALAGGEVGGVGTGRPDAADVPATLDDLAARLADGPIAVRRARAATSAPEAPLPAVAMRVLVALAELPGCTRIAIERGDGVVRAAARLTGAADPLRVEALAERARLAGGRLRRGWPRRSRIVLLLPAAPHAAPHPVDRNPWLRLPACVRAQGVPLLLCALEVCEALMAADGDAASYGPASTPVRVAGAVVLAAAFLPRRRWPLLTVALVVAIAWLRTDLLGDWFGLNPPLYLAAFVAAAYAKSLWAAALGGLLAAGGGVAVVVSAFGWAGYPSSVFLFFVTMVGAVWVTGVGGRRRLAQAEELRVLSAAEERRQARAIARAVNAERLRVARELHDLVGHGLTSITLQCAVADQLLDARPAAAASAIGAVEEVGEEVLRELHQLLAALDGGDEHEAPELARLPELARRAEAQGLRVRLELVGDVATVAAGPAGAAYRIVQEALTNARKHGGPVPVRARVAVDRGRLTVAVRNPLAAAPATVGAMPAAPASAPAPDRPLGSGLGLAGMRERVRVYDGWLLAGREPDGDWVVRAELPLAR